MGHVIKSRSRATCLAVALLGIGTAAGAAPADVADRSHGFYFNKPGATMAQGDADAEECGKRIAGTVPRGGAYAGPGLMGALVGGIGNGIATGLARGHNFENCMVIKGWREIYLTKADAAALDTAIKHDRVVALAPITAADPVTFGVIGRVWGNNYAEPRLREKGARK